MKRFLVLILFQCITACTLFLKDPTYCHIYLSSAVYVFVLSAIFMYLPDKFNNNDLYLRVSSYKFAAVISCILNMGVATQAISVGDSEYMNKCLLISTICGVMSLCVYKVVLPKLNLHFKVFSLLFFQVLIIVILIIDDLFINPAGAGSAVTIGGTEYVLALLLIPLFILTVVTLNKFKDYLKECAIYFCGLCFLGFNTLSLSLLSELGVLINILFVFLVWSLTCFESKKFFLFTLGLYIFFGVLGYQALKLMYVHYTEQGTVNFITNTYEKIELRVFSYLDLYGYKYTDDEVYQLRKARIAYASTHFFSGSDQSIEIPVFDSDLAFVYLCYKLGLVYGFIFLAFLVSLACYSSTLIIVKCDFERNVSTLFLFSLIFQSLFTVGGSSALAPLSGMPILYLSKSGLYMAIATAMLFIIISSTFESENDEYVNRRT